MRERGADHPLLRGQQARDGAVPDAVVVGVVERREAAEAGVVDEDVEAAEARGDVVDDAFDLGGIGYVESPSVRGSAAAAISSTTRATPASLMSVTATSAPSSANR